MHVNMQPQNLQPNERESVQLEQMNKAYETMLANNMKAHLPQTTKGQGGVVGKSLVNLTTSMKLGEDHNSMSQTLYAQNFKSSGSTTMKMQQVKEKTKGIKTLIKLASSRDAVQLQ